MSSLELSDLLAILPSLSLEELRLLRHGCDAAALTAKAAESVVLTPAEEADQELQQRLMDAGLIVEIKPPARLLGPRKAYIPIRVRSSNHSVVQVDDIPLMSYLG